MSWRKASALLLLAGNAAASEGYLVGAGLEADNSDGSAATLFGSVGLSERTWLSAAAARSNVEMPLISDITTWYGDVELDHHFDPVGVRVGAAYWGDADILKSNDLRGSLYWTGETVTLSGDYEYRDFRFILPATDNFAGRTLRFDAHGIGLSSNIDIGDNVSVGLSGIRFDYSVNLRIGDNRRILDLLSFSRLGLINSLVDYRAVASLAVDVGERRWQLGASQWRGAVDGSETRSLTARLLTPLGDSTDIEFGIGVDDSELYGTVTFFSVFLFFYGGG